MFRGEILVIPNQLRIFQGGGWTLSYYHGWCWKLLEVDDMTGQLIIWITWGIWVRNWGYIAAVAVMNRGRAVGYRWVW